MTRSAKGFRFRKAETRLFAILFALFLGVSAAQQGQTMPVCSDTPAMSERIECTEDGTSTDDIDIDAADVDIDTSGDSAPGVHAKHEGSGNVNVEVGADTIDTAGNHAHGIHGEHTGAGMLTINVQKTRITTTGDSSHGVYAEHTGDGNIDIDVVDGSNIDVNGGGDEYAIRAELDGDGDIDVLVDDTTTNNTIKIRHLGVGDSTVRVTNSTIDSDQENGIINDHSFNHGPPKDGRTDSSTYVTDTHITLSGDPLGYAVHGLINSNSTLGDVLVEVAGTTIGTTGAIAFGVKGSNLGEVGDVRVNVRDSTVNSVKAGIAAQRSRHSPESMEGRGSIYVDVRNTEVTTTGSGGFGIHAAGSLKSPAPDDVTKTYVENSTITTKGHYGHGIISFNGSGVDIVIETRGVDIVTESTEVDASGLTSAHGIFAHLERDPDGDGDIKIDVQGGSITTHGTKSMGIRGVIEAGNGDIVIETRGVDIVTESMDVDTSASTLAHGIFAWHWASDPVEDEGDIKIDVQGGSIETRGMYSYGIRGDLEAGNGGEISIATGGGNTITTTGEGGHGIVAYHWGTAQPTSAISIDAGGGIDTSGRGARGIQVGTVNAEGKPERVAAIGADGYRQQTVTVSGSVMSAAEGVFLAGGGKVIIEPGGSIASESGIAILATGDTPKLYVDMNLDGRRVAAVIGDDWIVNDGGETTIWINDTELHDGATGVTGAVAMNGAWNVTMREEGVTVDRTDPAKWIVTEPAAGVVADRDFSAEDFNETRRPTPPPPEPGLDEHFVTAPVFGGPGEAAGIIVEGDGAVYIGPKGSVGAESGIAILATGGAPEQPVNSNRVSRLVVEVNGDSGRTQTGDAEPGIAILATASAPKLLVDFDLDGRRVAEVIGDDWIINDGGETTIWVNDTKLHDGAAGVVAGAVALNGAWNVAMREEGVTVDDRSDPDPANWVISEPAAGVVADRDFTAEDFIEREKRHVFIEEYAPRAAVYEALPGFLLRLDGRQLSGKRLSSHGSPFWARLSGGRGSYEAGRASVGAQFDYGRFSAESGLDFSLDENAAASISVSRVSGSADVTAPTGGGKIEAEGFGVALGLSLDGANAYYARGALLPRGLRRRPHIQRPGPSRGGCRRARPYAGSRGRQAGGDARRGEPDAPRPAGAFGS